MSLNVGELHAKLGLRDSEFDRGLDRAGGRWSSFGAGLARTGAVAASAAGVALAGLATKGLMEFASLEKGMNEVFTLMPDIADKAMSQMTDQVREFNKEFGVLPDETVPALYQAISAGVPAGNVFDFLETAQKAAIGGVTDLTTAVDGISSVVNAYGSDVIDAAKASDLMFTAVRLGKTDFSQLSNSLFNVLPTASALGVGFEDITAAMAAMTAQGTPTSVATTQMRQLLVELSKDGTKTSETFKKIAGEGFADFIAGGGDVEEALALMARAAEKDGLSIADMFGSVEAGAAALSLTSKSGAKLFGDALKDMSKSAGATDKAFDRMDTGLSRSWDKIKAVISDSIIEIGERIAPFVQNVADWMEDKLPRAIEFFSGIWDRIFGNVGGTAERLSSTLGGVFGNVKQIVSVAVQIIGDLLRSLTGWFNENKDKIVSIMGKVQEVISKVTEAISKIWNTWGETILEGLKTVWDTVAGVISGVLDIVIGILDTFIGLFTGDWDRMREGLKRIWAGLWGAIVSIIKAQVERVFIVGRALIDKFGDWFKSLPGKIKGWLGDLGSLLVDSGKNLIRGLWDGIVSMGSWLKDKIVGWVKNVIPGPIASALGISSPSKVAAMLGKQVPAGLLQGMKSGTSDVVKAAENLGAAAAPSVDDLSLAFANAGVGERSASFGDIITQAQDPSDIADEITWKLLTAGI